MSKSLVEKWRPPSFALLWQGLRAPEVKAITRLLAHPPLGDGFAVTGPSGTGKTTLGRLVGMRCCCENTKLHAFEPCGRCEGCREVIRKRCSRNGYIEVDCGRLSVNKIMDDVMSSVQFNRHVRNEYDRWVVCLDEIDLALRSDLFRKFVEDEDRAIFILCTTDRKKIDMAFGDRGLILSTRHVSAEVAAERIMYIASAEGWRISKEAAMRIAEKKGGIPRNCLQVLKTAALLAAEGEITKAVVDDALTQNG